MDDKYPYRIYRDGELVMEATETCRYPRHIEKAMLEAGYTIRLHGKKITRSELRKEAQKK